MVLKFCSGSDSLDIEQLRREEFSVLMDDIYLDSTAAVIHPSSVRRRHNDFLDGNLLGNPHSNSPAALRTTKMINQVRAALLEYFNGSGEYDVIFTPNATGALKLIGEAYPWDPHTVLVLAKDNHNSVNGIRRFAREKCAQVEYWELNDQLKLLPELDSIIKRHIDKKVVVAFPAQSNFSGVIHPQSLIDEAHRLGATVLLDTAAYLPTHTLDLKAKKPEAIVMSFYKILGYPTGLGALIIRKDFLKTLCRPWFSGGTVRGVSFEDHVLQRGYAGFEDGTVNFQGIAALPSVLGFLKNLGGVEVIRHHTEKLTALTLASLSEIGNVRIYGPTEMKQGTEDMNRGSTIALNILDRQDKLVPYQEVERLAGKAKISLRTGRFCNPGVASRALGITREMAEEQIRRLRLDQNATIDLPGAVRISFGLHNNFFDVEKLIEFIRELASHV